MKRKENSNFWKKEILEETIFEKSHFHKDDLEAKISHPPWEVGPWQTSQTAEERKPDDVFEYNTTKKNVRINLGE